jgi:hypothetical protein
VQRPLGGITIAPDQQVAAGRQDDVGEGPAQRPGGIVGKIQPAEGDRGAASIEELDPVVALAAFIEVRRAVGGQDFIDGDGQSPSSTRSSKSIFKDTLTGSSSEGSA